MSGCGTAPQPPSVAASTAAAFCRWVCKEIESCIWVSSADDVCACSNMRVGLFGGEGPPYAFLLCTAPR